MAFVAFGALTACSFHGTRRPQFSTETNRIECTTDIGVPIFDVTIGLAAAGFAAYVYNSNNEDQESRDAAKQIAAPILLLSALAFVSGVYGFKKVSQCTEVKALEREEIRAAVAQRKHRKQAWGRAWAATQQAAAAA